MHYQESVIPEAAVPVSLSPVFQHAVDTYASEINKVASVWRWFSDADLGWRPHAKSSTVLEILKHELLSQRRFYGEFLGSVEPSPAEVLPREQTMEAFVQRLSRASGFSGRAATRVVAWERRVLRRDAPARLDLLAKNTAHGASSHAAQCVLAAVGKTSAIDIWADRGCVVGGG